MWEGHDQLEARQYFCEPSVNLISWFPDLCKVPSLTDSGFGHVTNFGQWDFSHNWRFDKHVHLGACSLGTVPLERQTLSYVKAQASCGEKPRPQKTLQTKPQPMASTNSQSCMRLCQTSYYSINLANNTWTRRTTRSNNRIVQKVSIIVQKSLNVWVVQK